MKTRWDCLEALLGLGEPTLGEIARKTAISPSNARARLLRLIEDGLVVQQGDRYLPNKANPSLGPISRICQFARERGHSPSYFLTMELAKIVRVGLSRDQVLLSDFDSSHVTVRRYLNVLSKSGLALTLSKKPIVVRLVQAPVLLDILELYGMKREKRAPGRSWGAADYDEMARLLSDAERKGASPEMRKVEFTAASIQLEGNTLTLDEVRELLVKDALPSGRKMSECLAARGSYESLDYLLSHLDNGMSVKLIMELHLRVGFGLFPNSLRTTEGFVRRNPFFRTSSVSEIVPSLERLCSEIDEFFSHRNGIRESVEFATHVHSEFQHIRPFDDGNARVSRLLWNYILLKSGFPLIIIPSSARDEYLSLTKLARERDDGKLNEFLARIIKDNLYRMTS